MKIRTLLVMLFTLLCWNGILAQESAFVSNVWGRKTISLDGEWKYLVDVQEMGFYDYRMKEYPWGFFQNAKPKLPSDLVEYDFDKSPSIQIPSDWNTADSKLFFYEGTVWLKKSFNYTRHANKRVLLYFGAVNYQAVVYVNGKKVGTHIGGFTPFNYDVTDVLKDGDNFIVVKVDNKRHADAVPTQIFDWWNYGGITRDVMLVEVNNIYVEDYHIQLAKGNPRRIQCQVKLNKPLAGVKVKVAIPELKLLTTLITNGEGVGSVQLKSSPVLWSPKNPKLYQVHVTLNGEVVTDEIGFRTIEARGKQILLNGKPIFLRGVAMHDEAPIRHGRVRTTEEAHQLLTWAKELGCNFVRLAHYPHNEKTIREAERMGLMVWDEIPCYWTIAWDNKDTYLNAQQQLHDMMKRDMNRANVIIWSVANETPHGESRDRFLRQLLQCARSQDSTRLLSLAMEVTSAKNYVNTLQDNMHDYVDVVSFNQYVGWYRDVNDAKLMKWVVPYNKPIIVSEFGGGALAGKHGDKTQRWTEEFQENLYKENLNMLGKIDGLAGTVPWLLVDYYSPRRPLYGIQDWHNRKGLISEKGEKKKAFYVVQSWYRQKANSQNKKDSVMAIINKVNGYWQNHHSPEVRSFWDEAAYHTGNVEAFKLTGNDRQLKYSRQWASYNHWEGATEPDTSKWQYKQYGEDMQHVLFGDWQTCFQTYLDLYMLDKANGKSGIGYMTDRTREVMDYMVRSTATDYWFWADALYMVMPVLSKMYKMTGDEKYLDKLYANLLYSDSIMLDKETGLYYRDAKYVYPAHKTITGKKDFWARGDGWVLAGLAKVLQDMPTSYKYYGFFKNKYLRLAKSVALMQQPEGYWSRSMLDEQQAPGYETSGTAFFTYGILWGVNNGLLSKTEMQPVIDRAWHYLTTKALQPSGKVGYVQPIGERAIPGQVVNANSEANFGVGAFLLAACEYYRSL